MQGDLAVVTPERAVLSYRLAGVGSRALAQIIDVVVLYVVLVLLEAFLALLAYFDAAFASGLMAFAAFALILLYFILLEGLMNGQTLGKRAVGIRVRMVDGTPIGLEAAILRNFLRPADLLPGFYLLGLVTMFLSSRAQRLGDLAAGTVVISERREASRYAVAPHGVGIHPLEQFVGPLRGLTMAEYSALRRLADRYYELPEEAQRDLIVRIYRPIAERRSIPMPPPGETEIRMVEAVVMAHGRRKGLL